ncbi:MAG: hypothetical protein QXT63_06950, partial [Thermoplasmata archaeon]
MRRQKRTGKGAICAAIVFGLVSAIFFAAALVPKECAHDENRGEKSERNIYGTSIEAWFELVAGSSTVITHTPASWHIRLTIKPIGEGNVTNITAKIAFGAEFHITSVYASSGSVEKTSSGNGQMNSTKVTWRIDSLIDDESLDIILSTSLNPAGKQEFTSAGNYRLGSATIDIDGDSIEVNGPIVKAIDCGNDDDDDCPCNAQPEFTYSVNYTKSIYIEGVDGLQNLPLNTSFISDE